MNKKREIICICCPRGCHLQVDPENDYNVTGNACPNGAAYGKEELTHPTRILTSTVRAEGGRYPRCPVKTAQAVPKEKIVQVMAALDGVTLHAPIRTGSSREWRWPATRSEHPRASSTFGRNTRSRSSASSSPSATRR